MNFKLILDYKYINNLFNIIKKKTSIFICLKNNGLFILDNINNYSNIIFYIEKKLFNTYIFNGNSSSLILNDIYLLKNLNSKNTKDYILIINEYILPDYILNIKYNNIFLKYKDLINNKKFINLKNNKFKIKFSKNYESILALTYFKDIRIYINILL